MFDFSDAHSGRSFATSHGSSSTEQQSIASGALQVPSGTMSLRDMTGETLQEPSTRTVADAVGLNTSGELVDESPIDSGAVLQETSLFLRDAVARLQRENLRLQHELADVTQQYDNVLQQYDNLQKQYERPNTVIRH